MSALPASQFTPQLLAAPLSPNIQATAAPTSDAASTNAIVDDKALGLTALSGALTVASFVAPPAFRRPLLIAGVGVGLFAIVRTFKRTVEAPIQAVKDAVNNAAQAVKDAVNNAADAAAEVVSTVVAPISAPVGQVTGSGSSSTLAPGQLVTDAPFYVPQDPAEVVTARWISPGNGGDIDVGALAQTFPARIEISNRAKAPVDAPIDYEVTIKPFIGSNKTFRGKLNSPFLPLAGSEVHVKTYNLPLAGFGNADVSVRLLIRGVAIPGGSASFTVS